MRDISSQQAGEMIEARLGRPAQDALEAAVVLEAWAGVPPTAALALGEQAVAEAQRRADHGRLTARLSAWHRPLAGQKALLAEGAALLIAVVAVALWTGPFGDALGSAVWDGAVRIALPLTLALQWILRSRYLGRPNGLASLKRHWPAAMLVFVCLGSTALTLGVREQVAALLILTWVCGPVIVRRGWWPLYVLILVGATVVANIGVHPLQILAVTGAFTTLTAVFALSTAKPGPEAPGRMSRALAAGLTGAGIGCLLVADTTIGWGTEGVLPALALVPSAVGGFWGGVHLWRFQEDLPRALAGVPVAEADRLRFRGPALTLLTGAVMRLVVITTVLSAAVLAAVPYLSHASSSAPIVATPRVSEPRTPVAAKDELGGDSGRSTLVGAASPVGAAQEPAIGGTGGVALLLGFALVALATLLISLLQALGYPSRAVFSVCCGLAAELSLAWWGDGRVPATAVVIGLAMVTPPLVVLLRSLGYSARGLFGVLCGLGAAFGLARSGAGSVPGAGLVVGALVAVIVALPATISLFLRPGRVLATTMWIQ